jgi:hypothetical protein
VKHQLVSYREWQLNMKRPHLNLISAPGVHVHFYSS